MSSEISAAPAAAAAAVPVADAVASNPRIVLFYTKASVFSNFYPCKFSYHGVLMLSSEQAFVWEKAKHFLDSRTMDDIVASKTPYTARTLGRKVKPFDAKEWDDVREQYMEDVLFAKFTSSHVLRGALLDTGDALIAEASPVDRQWGIGLAAADPRAQDPAQWRGKNLLGKALMRVRAKLAYKSEGQETKRARVE